MKNFYIRELENGSIVWKPVKAAGVNIDKHIKFFTFKKHTWGVYEVSTGVSLGIFGKTKEEAIAKAKERVEACRPQLLKAIADEIAKHGQAPKPEVLPKKPREESDTEAGKMGSFFIRMPEDKLEMIRAREVKLDPEMRFFINRSVTGKAWVASEVTSGCRISQTEARTQKDTLDLAKKFLAGRRDEFKQQVAKFIAEHGAAPYELADVVNS